MSELDLLRYREILNKELESIEHTLRKMKKNKESERATELSNYDNHPAELGSELYAAEQMAALMVHEEEQINKVKEALRRIEDGSYGICMFCGNPIGALRLEAVPHAKLCIDCEDENSVKVKKMRTVRANEEKVLDAPIGRKYLNKREDDEHEGMDQLNDLMKYGSADTPQDLGGYNDYEEYYTNMVDQQGVVDDMDRISNDIYKRQLPD